MHPHHGNNKIGRNHDTNGKMDDIEIVAAMITPAPDVFNSPDEADQHSERAEQILNWAGDLEGEPEDDGFGDTTEEGADDRGFDDDAYEGPAPGEETAEKEFQDAEYVMNIARQMSLGHGVSNLEAPTPMRDTPGRI